MSMSETVIGEVRAHLARQRRSAQSVALQLGWTQRYFSRRLTGQVPFTIDDLAAIAEVLDVPISALLEAPVPVRKPGSAITQLTLAVAA